MTHLTWNLGPTTGERAGLLLLSLTSNVLALALPLALLQVYDRIVPNQAQGTAAVLFSAVLVALLADGFLRYVRFRTLAHSAPGSGSQAPRTSSRACSACCAAT